MRVSEGLGKLGGALLAPVFATGTLARRSRVVHPEGYVFRGTVTPVTTRGHLFDTACRLEGRALIRLSSAWWKGGQEKRDLLGFAMRIGSGRVGVDPAPDDQDLLFATLRSPWTALLATLTTNTHDFLANDYYAVTPFDVEGFGRARLRIVSPHVQMPGTDRTDRLLRAVESGMARFWIELKPVDGATGWKPLAEITLEQQLQVAQGTLRFSPYQSGRGFRPSGFIHALRKATYPAAQRTRALFQGARFPTSLPRVPVRP